MKSIKQQYIDLKEGRMSQANFMRNLRMTMPQYITNVTSFKDSVRILKNKGILTEAYANEAPFYNYNGKKLYVDNQSGEPDAPGGTVSLYDEDNNEYKGIISSIDREGMIYVDEESIEPNRANDEAYPEDYDDSYPTDYGNIDDYNDGEFWEAKDGDDDDAEVLAMLDKIAAEKEGEEDVMAQYDESLNEAKSWTNASGKDMYAQFKEIDNLNGQEILIGIDQELEKNPELSKTEAAKIVIKNLKKNPNYYTDFFLAGNKEMNEIPTIGKLIPGSDKMKALKTEADLTDKDNGMKPVKGIEKAKASANKASKETNKPEGTISLMSLVAKTSKGVTKMTATGEKMKVVKEDYQSWLSQKKGEEAEAAKIKQATNADNITFNINDKATTPEGDEITIKGFMVDKDGKTKAIYMASTGMFADAIDVDGLTKKKDIRPGVNLGKYNLKDLTELVREVLAEMESDDEVNTDTMLGLGETFDGRDNLTDTAGHQLDENK